MAKKHLRPLPSPAQSLYGTASIGGAVAPLGNTCMIREVTAQDHTPGLVTCPPLMAALSATAAIHRPVFQRQQAREEPEPPSPGIGQPWHHHHGRLVVAQEEEEEVPPTAEGLSAGVHIIGPQCPHCGSDAVHQPVIGPLPHGRMHGGAPQSPATGLCQLKASHCPLCPPSVLQGSLLLPLPFPPIPTMA